MKKETKSNNFKLGDTVIIKYTGNIFPTYDKAATAMELKRWKPQPYGKERKNLKDTKGKIVGIVKHNDFDNSGFTNYQRYVIGIDIGEEEILIGEPGIEKVEGSFDF